MALKAVHASLDDIPEQYRDLYTEKNGQFELTGISGVKTQADIDRLQTSLTKEREEHKATKDKFAVWGDMDHEDVMVKLDRIPELEAAAEGKLDDAAIEDMVNKRLEGTLKSRTSPLERQITQLSKDNEELKAQNEALQAEKTTRTVHDAVRAELVKNKVIPEAHEDALMLADRIFEVNEEGKVVTRDQVGVTPGVDADVWLKEMQDKRPHWWPSSSGGGARGGNAGGIGGGKNPWSREHWNATEQARIYKAEGVEKAEQLARAAGTKVGGPMPEARK